MRHNTNISVNTALSNGELENIVGGTQVAGGTGGFLVQKNPLQQILQALQVIAKEIQIIAKDLSLLVKGGGGFN
jgi:hypothetical protein